MKKIELTSLPELDDLRDSSFVAQESDIVLMMWRNRIKFPALPEGYKMTNETFVSVKKNRRTGNLGTIKVVYDFNVKRFLEENKNYENNESIPSGINPRDIFAE